MKRFLGAMNRLALALLAATMAATLVSAPANAQRRDKALEAALMAHVTELASDAYEGREPGTEGEAKTLRYLGRQWFDIGLESGTNDPANAWFAPVRLVAREPASSSTHTRPVTSANSTAAAPRCRRDARAVLTAAPSSWR